MFISLRHARPDRASLGLTGKNDAKSLLISVLLLVLFIIQWKFRRKLTHFLHFTMTVFRGLMMRD